jgi:anti-sigma factor RsiW
MIEPPVTIDELHAYADGELPPDRRDAVEAWLVAHPADAARVLDWQAQAELVRARYDAVANEPVPARFDFKRIDRTGRAWRAIAAAAAVSFVIGGAAGWVAHGAAAAAPSNFDAYTADALDAYKLFVVEVRHPVDVPGAEREHLVQWLSKRVGSDLRAPAARAPSSCTRDRRANASPSPVRPRVRSRRRSATGRRSVMRRSIGSIAASPT